MTAGALTARSKVLVADDAEVDRSTAQATLAAAGYEVVEAVDGQHALEVFARERPELVLLDVVMPRLTGVEVCRILKAKTPTTYLPVILVSTRNSVNARVEGLRAGADDYLGKPYDEEELRARVDALLRARRALLTEATSASRGRLPIEPLLVSRGEEAFRRRVAEEFDRAQRFSDPLACLRVELDGYAEQDETVARAWAEQLRTIIESSVRKIDLVYASEPQGYVLVLPNTHFPGALAVAERIWRGARRLRRPDAQGGGAASVSIGVSFFPNKDTHTLRDLEELVEAALRRARNEGGGKICLFQHQGYLYAPED